MKDKVSVFELISIANPVEPLSLIHGTMEDIRKFAKNLWAEYKMEEDVHMHGFQIEEDYYAYMDNDTNLLAFLDEYFGYYIEEVCVVSIEDFYE